MIDLSIIVPVRNEEKNIQKLCKTIHQSMNRAGIGYEVIIVDDHSTDNTKHYATKLQKNYPVRFFSKVGKRGKGFSILEGASHAKASIICMIDADLQYSPDHIPAMLKLLQRNPDTGVVIAKRKRFKAGLIRRLGSRFGAFLVGKLLFGFNLDIQSGLKLFKKDILKHIHVQAVGPWSFDIPLLHATRELGYIIEQLPITFESRDEGESKVRFFNVGFEIVKNALKVRLGSSRIYGVDPHTSESMIGSGMIHKRKRYITHTTLTHHNSAVKTLHGWQGPALLGLLTLAVLGVVGSPTRMIVSTFAFLNAMYFFDVFFNLYMTVKTLYTSAEIVSTDEELKALKERDLPVYTVLCPLYKEANIIPQFVEAMSKLEWPKSKLDVMLLLEEDDIATIEAAENANLPTYIRIVVVPHSLPKTKPKATNYGLAHSKGEYVVIYDAEDIPDPLQLKKAYLGFQKSPAHVVCLQAKLNYYNPHQNVLTRIFTAEYSLWFDLILPGLQSIEAPLPLGGTSNHFRRTMLTELEGWDSFNVTEDCDLGIRLAKYGYQTAIIDSVTMEEANSNLGNWINQRSRWIKGYIQSYLVHMRSPRTFARTNLKNFLLFQLVVGGKILALFINPIMWLITILYFASRSTFGIYIEQLFPGPVLYMGVFSMIIGNFVYLYYYMVACAKRKHFELIKFVYIVPFYWLAMSYAGYKALSELFYKPHFWQKTVHGLHLKKVEPAEAQSVTTTVSTQTQVKAMPLIKEHNKRFHMPLRHIYKLIFVASIGVSSVLNFAYSAYLGRILNFEDFALISLLTGLVGITTIASSAFSNTVNYRSSYLIGKHGEEHAYAFWKRIRMYSFYISMGIAGLWLIASPVMFGFFKTTTIIPLILFSPVLLVNLISAADRGYVGGNLRFGSLSVIYAAEPFVKLVAAVSLVYLGYTQLAYLAIPISTVGIFFIGQYLAYHIKTFANTHIQKISVPSFPAKFFALSLIAEFSIIFFINFDVILAKHFLSPIEAGQYALLALAGKIIFFGGSFVTPFIVPLVSRYEGQNKNPDTILYITLLLTALTALAGYTVIGVFGHITIPLLFGEKMNSVLGYLPMVAGGLAFFTISKVFNDFHLVKKHFSFQVSALLLSMVQLLLMIYLNQSLSTFVYVTSAIWMIHLLMNIVLHMNIKTVTRIEKLMLHYFYSYFQKAKSKTVQKKKLSILIFNWRDTKHKWAGGAEVYIQELAKRWVKEGNSVTLFCGSDKKSPQYENQDGVEIIRRGGFCTVYVWAFFYYILKFRGKYDVIVDCENGIPFFTPIYAKEKVLLLVHHVHQEVFRKSLPLPLAQFAQFLEARVMPLVYRNVQFVTVSPSSRDEIMKHNLTKKEPKIIYNGLDFSVFKPGKKSVQPMVMYLGRLQYYKSLNVFIKAARDILETNPRVKFVIAGEGEKRESLEKYAKKLGIHDKITFLGRVSDEKKVELLQKAWVMVNPSIMEGWAITTLEANACGTPAVASDVPGLRDSVIHNQTGYLVRYGDHTAFAEHILKLIKNATLRTRMSKESVKWSRTFGWDTSADEFLHEISSTLSIGNHNYDTHSKSVRHGLLHT